MLGAFQPPEKLSNETHTQPRTPRRLTPSIRPESPSISRLLISIDCARAVLPYFAILRQFFLSASRESGPIGCPDHKFRLDLSRRCPDREWPVPLHRSWRYLHYKRADTNILWSSGFAERDDKQTLLDDTKPYSP